MISNLSIKNVEFARELDFEFGSRLNLITGDNGLGKSFVLECLWWALTGRWTTTSGLLRSEKEHYPSLKTLITDFLRTDREDRELYFDNKKRQRTDQFGHCDSGLTIFSRVDGGFAISFSSGIGEAKSHHVVLNPQEVWNGRSKGTYRTEGLYRDIVTWLQTNSPKAKTLLAITESLSPDMETLRFTESRRLYPRDGKLYPILRLPYGDIPLSEASAGIRRVMALAYVTTWAYYEDKEIRGMSGLPPSVSRSLIIDEMESHLHPLWQRKILPSLIGATGAIDDNKGFPFQFFIATHSPLVLASVETIYDQDTDKLFHLKLKDQQACVEDLPWVPQGTVGYWLTSEVFGLGEARSKEAEVAIRAAKDFMLNRLDRLPEFLNSQEKIHEELLRTLPGQDPFWAHWIVKVAPED